MPGYSMGWLPDAVDERDYTKETEAVSGLLSTSLLEPVSTFPNYYDLSGWFPSVQDQGRLGSCTAHAIAGIIQYYQKRAFGKETGPSRRFIYRMSRKLDGLTGDSGAYLRTTMKSLAMIGAPPEKYWHYSTALTVWDKEPTAFIYALADRFHAFKYYRIDPPGVKGDLLINEIKNSLTEGRPLIFGVMLFDNYPASGYNGGVFPIPTTSNSIIGGHAMVIVGWDDGKQAFKLRNSWGSSWGANGYGWLPYWYVKNGHASDFWSLASADFVDMTVFD